MHEDYGVKVYTVGIGQEPVREYPEGQLEKLSDLERLLHAPDCADPERNPEREPEPFEVNPLAAFHQERGIGRRVAAPPVDSEVEAHFARLVAPGSGPRLVDYLVGRLPRTVNSAARVVYSCCLPSHRIPAASSRASRAACATSSA